jgi:hypothetical protein
VGRTAQLDAGHRFRALDGSTPFRGVGVRPRFDEVLESFPGMRINVECKAAEAARPLARAIDGGAEGASDRCVQGPRAPERADTPLGRLLRQVAAVRFFGARAPCRHPGCPSAGAGSGGDPGLRRVAHRLNLPVQVWTVDDPADCRLLAWGVDGIRATPTCLRVLVEVARRPAPPGSQRRSVSRKPLPSGWQRGCWRPAAARGDRVVVAVSGRLDSVVLLHLLRFAPGLGGLDPVAATWMPDAPGERGRRWVAELARVGGAGRAGSRRRAAVPRSEAGRDARYAFLGGRARAGPLS